MPPEDEGVLREKIKGQVEYYLSRQNLLQVFDFEGCSGYSVDYFLEIVLMKVLYILIVSWLLRIPSL